MNLSAFENLISELVMYIRAAKNVYNFHWRGHYFLLVVIARVGVK